MPFLSFLSLADTENYFQNIISFKDLNEYVKIIIKVRLMNGCKEIGADSKEWSFLVKK